MILGSGRTFAEGIGYPFQYSWASLMAQMVKNLPAMPETWVQSLGWKFPWRKAWQPTPVFMPGESPGQRSLVCYSLWGCKELDRTEQLIIHPHCDDHYNINRFYVSLLMFKALEINILSTNVRLYGSFCSNDGKSLFVSGKIQI